MAKSTSKLFQSEEPKEMKEDAMNLPEKVEEKKVEEEVIPAEKTEIANTPKSLNNDIQDIDLSAIRKKRFRINGDNTKILELNTSDLNISSRLKSAYDRLNAHMEKVGNVLATLPDDGNINEEEETVIRDQLAEIDSKMREEVDYIFDAPVSDICCDGGSMYDPFDGMFRYEHIIDAISKLYETNLNSEFSKMRRRVSAKTSKYTKKYHN